MTRFYWELHKTAHLILEAISLGLGLTSEEKANILKTHSGENNQLRLLHYPPVSAEMIEKQVLARYTSISYVFPIFSSLALDGFWTHQMFPYQKPEDRRFNAKD